MSRKWMPMMSRGVPRLVLSNDKDALWDELEAIGRAPREREARNGYPESGGYVWQRGHEAREAEVAARIATARAEARRRYEAEQEIGESSAEIGPLTN